jgi:anaerobic dimethyl sulfoxide reductase subunit B (iron-sulfur subunit)
MSQRAFYFNADDCIGCKTCVAACKDQNNLPGGVGLMFRRVYEYGGGEWEKDSDGYYDNEASGVFNYFVSVSCNHCEDPICVKVCPVGANEKLPNGVVYKDSSKCIACMNCINQCPYNSPLLLPHTGKSGKCNFCTDPDRGHLMGEPACVTACLMRCLKHGELSVLQAQYGTTNADIPPLPSSGETGPAIVIKPSTANQGAGEVLNPLEVGRGILPTS